MNILSLLSEKPHEQDSSILSMGLPYKYKELEEQRNKIMTSQAFKNWRWHILRSLKETIKKNEKSR